MVVPSTKSHVRTAEVRWRRAQDACLMLRNPLPSKIPAVLTELRPAQTTTASTATHQSPINPPKRWGRLQAGPEQQGQGLPAAPSALCPHLGGGSACPPARPSAHPPRRHDEAAPGPPASLPARGRGQRGCPGAVALPASPGTARSGCHQPPAPRSPRAAPMAAMAQERACGGGQQMAAAPRARGSWQPRRGGMGPPGTEARPGRTLRGPRLSCADTGWARVAGARPGERSGPRAGEEAKRAGLP